MRIADPAELSAETRLESVLTATMSPQAVSSLSSTMCNVDPFNAPGPAKIAVLQLDAGPLVAVVYHEIKELLEVLAPLDGTTEAALAEIVDVLRIPRECVEWVRDGIALSHVYHDADETSPQAGTLLTAAVDLLKSALPPARFYEITASQSLAERPMTASETISLMLLILQLRVVAGTIPPAGNTSIRRIELRNNIVFEDGSEAVPLAVYYTISEDGSTVSIVDIARLASETVKFASGTVSSVLTQVASLKFVA